MPVDRESMGRDELVRRLASAVAADPGDELPSTVTIDTADPDWARYG
jgi:hypothetical protein